jgi:hypothetical protein
MFSWQIINYHCAGKGQAENCLSHKNSFMPITLMCFVKTIDMSCR